MKILKTATVLFIILIYFPLTYSQNMRFSFVVNPGISWLHQNDDKTRGDGPVTGISTGVLADFFFSQRYAFSTGILFNNVGGKLIYPVDISLKTSGNNTLVPAGYSIKYNSRYIGVPVGLKFKTIELGYMTYWLNLGITPEVRVGSSMSASELIKRQNANQETRFLNLNYFMKGGLEYSLGGETALIGGLGFNSGIFDLTRRSNEKVFPRTISLVIGILF